MFISKHLFNPFFLNIMTGIFQFLTVWSVWKMGGEKARFPIDKE